MEITAEKDLAYWFIGLGQGFVGPSRNLQGMSKIFDDDEDAC